jgi:hypothetical protein
MRYILVLNETEKHREAPGITLLKQEQWHKVSAN